MGAVMFLGLLRSRLRELPTLQMCIHGNYTQSGREDAPWNGLCVRCLCSNAIRFKNFRFTCAHLNVMQGNHVLGAGAAAVPPYEYRCGHTALRATCLTLTCMAWLHQEV